MCYKMAIFSVKEVLFNLFLKLYYLGHIINE